MSTSPTIFTTRDLRWSCYGRSSTAQPTPAINGAPCIPHWTWALPVDRGTTWQFALSQQPQGPPRWFRRLCAHVEVPTEPKTGHKGCHGLKYVCTNLLGLTYLLVYVLKCQAAGPTHTGGAQRSTPHHNGPMTGNAASRLAGSGSILEAVRLNTSSFLSSVEGKAVD